MIIGKRTMAAGFLMLALGSQAMATEDFGYLNGGREDYTGTSALGVDISHVGWAPSAAHAFVANLSPVQAQSVERSCGVVLDRQVDYNTEVAMFCHNLLGK